MRLRTLTRIRTVTPVRIFDTHCHLGGTELRAHAPQVASRALEAGVAGMAIICADVSDLPVLNSLTKSLRTEFPQSKIVYTSGIHPHEGDGLTDAQTSDSLWKQILELAEGAAAIGETGLDYHYDHSDRGHQKSAFQKHIELAASLKKPLVIHCREAASDILAMLDCPAIKNHPNPGILHCFSEDLGVAKTLVDRGFYISFSGILTFRNADPLRTVARELPLERILLETDSPWLAPVPQRGKRNEPAFITHLFEHFCTLRPEDPAEIERVIWNNSCRVFGVESP